MIFFQISMIIFYFERGKYSIFPDRLRVLYCDTDNLCSSQMCMMDYKKCYTST